MGWKYDSVFPIFSQKESDLESPTYRVLFAIIQVQLLVKIELIISFVIVREMNSDYLDGIACPLHSKRVVSTVCLFPEPDRLCFLNMLLLGH